jgi:hypothetical protein
MTDPAPSLSGRSLLARLAPAVVLTAVVVGVVIWVATRPKPIDPTTGPGPTPAVDPSKQSEEPTGPPVFREVTAASGLDFTYRNGDEAEFYTILETLGGGVALIDYDGDGLLDVFVTGGGSFAGPDKHDLKGYPCRLFKNLGGFKFRDVTKEAGLDREWWYTHGIAVADYDRDGWPDLLVTGYGKLALFHNEPDRMGGRRFRDVTAEVGLSDTSWSTSAAFADIDGDGFPDLYVCHYVDWSWANNPRCPGLIAGVDRDVCPPQRFKPLVHAIWKNEGGKRFRDVSAENDFKPLGCGLGVVATDFDGDGRPDFYVANDATNNFLWLNRGGRLEEVGLTAGVAVDDEGHFNGSMGTDAGDYDGTGRPSIFVTNFQGDQHALYRNLGGGQFVHVSRAAGVTAIGMQWVGFGTAFLDYDNDGWEDLVLVNGHVLHHPVLSASYRQRPILFRNTERAGRRFFRDASKEGGKFFDAPTLGRGLAVGDLDNDGWPDIVVSHTNTPVAVLRNEGAQTRPTHRWVGFRLVGKGNRDVTGSTLTVEAGGRKFTRFAKGGGSYLSVSDPRLMVGLGAAEGPVTVTVRWAWGMTETWPNVARDSYWQLTEGAKELVRLSGTR